MANPKIKRHKMSRPTRDSDTFPVPTFAAPTIAPILKFAESDLGKVVNTKLNLPKFSAVLKRRETKGVKEQDINSLQLELENLLVSTMKRTKILLNECRVLEDAMSNEECKDLVLNQEETSGKKVVGEYTNTSLIIQLRKSTPAISRRLKRNARKKFISSSTYPSLIPPPPPPPPLPTALQLTNKESCKGKLLDLVNIESLLKKPSTSQPPINKSTDLALIENKLSGLETCLPEPNKIDKDDGFGDLNSLHGNISFPGSKDGNITMQKQTLKLAKAKRIVKPIKPVFNPPNRNRNKRNDRSKKYWQSISHIVRGIFEPDLKSLEELLKSQEVGQGGSVEAPTVGALFASKWAQSEISEEKVAASESSVPRKSSGHVSEDVLCLIKRAEKSVYQERTLENLESVPIYEQLLTSLMDEKIIPRMELENEAMNFSYSPIEDELVPNSSEIENAMREDLISIGVISSDSIVRADTKKETEIDLEIKLMEDKLRTVKRCNVIELNRIVKLTKVELRKQNLNRLLINKGRELERAYQSIIAQKKKKESARKQVKRALVLVNEHENILCQLKLVEG